jgi:hypothetical protein
MIDQTHAQAPTMEIKGKSAPDYPAATPLKQRTMTHPAEIGSATHRWMWLVFPFCLLALIVGLLAG